MNTLLLILSDIGNAFELFDKLGNKFFLRLLVDLITIIILIRLIYLPNNKRREKIFTFLLFNVIIFLITYLMNKVEMSMGAAFGLFAVFAMLRYRTEDISTKDMTYLFLSIAIGLLNAVSKGNWDELIVINLILIVVTFLLESNWLFKKEIAKMIWYEKIELITPEHKDEMKADLELRLGIKINRIEINKIDLLRDAAQVFIFYYE
jgi:hypothetical protein